MSDARLVRTIVLTTFAVISASLVFDVAIPLAGVLAEAFAPLIAGFVQVHNATFAPFLEVIPPALRPALTVMHGLIAALFIGRAVVMLENSTRRGSSSSASVTLEYEPDQDDDADPLEEAHRAYREGEIGELELEERLEKILSERELGGLESPEATESESATA